MFFERIGELIPEVSHKLIEHPRQSVYYNHIHNNCELLLFLQGAADYNIDGQSFTLSPYDLLFIPAATYHYLLPTASEPYENYVIGISPDLIDSAQYEKLFTKPLVINIKEDKELRQFFTRLDLYHATFSPADFASCASALIHELVTYCSYAKRALHSVRSGNIAYIDEIITYINDHIEERLDAERIAHHFLLSRSYVQNMFSQSMHIGLKKYVMQKKIYAAHADLAKGLSPSAVCEKYAFGDYSVFYRLYRTTFNCSPSSKG